MRLHVACLAGLLSLSAAAGAAPARSSTLKRAELLAAAFRDRSAEPLEIVDGKIESIDLPGVAWPWLPSVNPNTTSTIDTSVVDVLPLNVIRLDDTHAVLLTQTSALDDDGQEVRSSYGGLHAIGAYFFTRDDAGWSLGRHDDVVTTVYDQQGIHPHVDAWPGHGFVVSIRQPFYAQGAGSETITLLGVVPDKVLFTFDTGLNESNDHVGELDCEPLMDPTFKPPRNKRYDDVECRTGEGTWSLERDDIRFDFKLARRAAGPNGRLAPLEQKSVTVILKPVGGKLKVESGQLPQFGF